MLGDGIAGKLLAKILHHIVALELTMDEHIDANLLLPTYRGLCLPLQEAVVVGVAQGDSWFDYLPAFFEDPFSGDLLGHLHRTGRYNIFKAATAGDTLENMSYGTAVGGDGSAKPQEIDTALNAVKTLQASFYLLSAGGNDMAGSNGVNLEFYLNHGQAWDRDLYSRLRLRDSRRSSCVQGAVRMELHRSIVAARL